MTTAHSKEVHIIVQSKYPHVLKQFEESFWPTVSEFTNLTLHKIDGEAYGAKEINKIIRPIIAKKEGHAFGVFNDDLIFSHGWLEHALGHLENHHCISVGYVDTSDEMIFQSALQRTEDETGLVDFLYGPTAIFRADTFQKIGLFDEQFDWSVDDLDWALRFYLNKMQSYTTRRVFVAHRRGTTLTRNSSNMKKWHTTLIINKERFYDKHGYRSYRNLRNWYLTHHQYFKELSYGDQTN